MGKYTAKQIKERYAALKSGRSNWETQWQEVTDYMIPRKNNVTRKGADGEKKNPQLLDNTGVMSNELLAGALHGLLTSPSAQWFELSTGSPELDKDDDVRTWLQACGRQMLVALNNSNFQTEVHELYLDLTSIGTAPMLMEEDDDEIVRFGSKFIAETTIAEDNKGRVNEVYREFEWTARQIVAEFGNTEAKVGRKVMDALKKNSEEKFKIIHATYPQKSVDGKQKGQFEFMSQYVLECEDNHELRQKGFREFPYLCPRWSKASGEVYGRSPGMVALPECKTINKMTETTIIGAQKVVDPPLQAPDDGFLLPLVTKPGGLNYYRSGSNERIEPILNDARIDFGFQALTERRQRIREAFFVDQLQLGTGPQMTATEVNQRTEEKMRLLGPMLGRMESEFLGPLIFRLFRIMERRDLLPARPDKLNQGELVVRYSSVIARAQRQAEGQTILRTLQVIQPFVEMDPQVVDNFDGDKAVRSVAEIYGFPQELIRNQKQVQSTRDARAKAQQEAVDMQKQQAEADQAATLAKSAKEASAVQPQGA